MYKKLFGSLFVGLKMIMIFDSTGVVVIPDDMVMKTGLPSK